ADQPVHPHLAQFTGPALGLYRGTQPPGTLGIDKVGETVVLIAQPEEQLAGDEVDQAVLQRPGREAYPAVTAQARLAEDVTFAEAVEQLAIGPVDLHRATADIVQLVEGSVLVQNGGACLEVAHLGLAGNIVESVF